MKPARTRRVRAVVLSVIALAGPVGLGASVDGPAPDRPRVIAQIAADTVAPRATTAAVPATAAGTAAPRIGSSDRPAGALVWRSVLVHGAVRRYLVATPAGNGPHPLLVVLHGLNERTGPFLAATGIVRDALAAGVAVAGPETPDGAWNDGRFGSAGRDDDGYVLAVVDALVADRVAAPNRVTLAGFSNGAGLSVELVSRHPGRFAALVLVGGELLEGPGMPMPNRAIRTLLVHGTDDAIQPWQGRARRGPRMPAQVGVPATLAAFVRAASGTPSPARTLPHTPGSIPVTVQTWTGDAQVQLYRLVGAGHVWPVTTCPTGYCRPASDIARLADVSATTLAVQTAVQARS